MAYQLSKGHLKQMLDGHQVSDSTLQIMQVRSIHNNMDGTTRFKVSLFDGESSHTFGILATQKNHLVEDNLLRIGSIIHVTEFAANVISKEPPKVVIILLNFEIIGNIEDDSQDDDMIRNDAQEASFSKPVQNIENIEPKAAVEVAVKKPEMTSKTFFNKKEEEKPKKMMTASPQKSAAPAGTFNGFKITNISSLNPYQNRWSIQARITNKSPIRTYTNAKGEGKLFNFEMMDSSGEIKCAGFNDSLDKFYDMLQIDKVFYISKCQLKVANKQYSRLTHEYEMTLTNDSMIEACNEQTESMPAIKLEITKLNDLENKKANDFVDVIGIVQSCADISSIVTKATNKELKKREIMLVDDTNFSIACTLWGKQAEEYDAEYFNEFPVLLLKGAKLGDYNGQNLSVGGNTVFQLNPDIPEAHKLRGWYDQGGSEAEVKTLSNLIGVGGGTGGPSPFKNIKDIALDKLGMGDKPDYFSVKGTVLYSKKDSALYMACPTDKCNKKVVDQNDGTFRCEKCNENKTEFQWRMVLSCNLADHTDSTWATCFQESGELMLGIKAQELGELKNADPNKYDELFSEVVFKEYMFKLRARMETYNDERRVKCDVLQCDEINYGTESKRLLQAIKGSAAYQQL